MLRVLTESLIEWKDDPYKKPLIIRGVSQCGKTYLLKDFGSKYYKDVLYINFSEDRHYADLFKQNIHPRSLIKNMSLLRDMDIKPESTLIIFDEIHSCLPALKLLENINNESLKDKLSNHNVGGSACRAIETNYHLIATGSFFDIILPKVNVLTLFPMSFYEFLLAQNSMLAMHLKESAFKDDALSTFSSQLEEMFYDF
ncbi:MAG: AAA family ATPase, partial [Oscillospiraceae bacterium]|nr:AAA family ATPase [Oscillospiraceae bacterium]